MKDDFTIKRIIAYGIGVLFICTWAIFKIIPYEISMYLATFTLSFCLLLEAKYERKEKRLLAKFKCVLAIVIIIAILLLISFKIM